MSENKGLVKCVLGFLLAILVIAGGIFGLNVDVEVTENTENATTSEETFGPVYKDVPTEVPVDTTDEVVDSDESPADSTPTEDEQPVVDESDGAEVTQPTDNTEDVVTEGEN
jgi:hypothetical protein